MRIFTRSNAKFKRMSKRRQKNSALYSLFALPKISTPNAVDVKSFINSRAWLAEVSGVVSNVNELKDSFIIER